MSNRCFAFILVGIAISGCSRTADRPLVDVEERLLKIGSAYLQATYRLKRPPKNVDEIKPELGSETTEELLISPRDSQPFVILWGVDFSGPPASATDPFLVAAYEKAGLNGKRYVLRFPKSIALMSDEELSKAIFPSGHRPPA